MRALNAVLLMGLTCGLLAGCAYEDRTGQASSVEYIPKGSPNPEAPVAVYNPVSQPMTVPFPNNLLFRGSRDGTIDAPVTASRPGVLTRSLNKLDGFSTVASAYAAFDRPLAADQNFSDAVLVFQLERQGTIVEQLEFGASSVEGLGQYRVSGDYTVRLEGEKQQKMNDRLLIVPLKPLKPETRYLIVITRDLLGENGVPVRPSAYFKAVTATVPVAEYENPVIEKLTIKQRHRLEAIRQRFQALFDALKEYGVMRSEIAAAWTYTTQYIGDSLVQLRKKAKQSRSGKIALAYTGRTTADFGGAGKAAIYVGTVTLPYHLGVPTQKKPKASLKYYWHIDTSQTPASGFTATGTPCSDIVPPESTTACYPLPRKTALVTVPVLVTVPLVNGQPKEGRPTVIFQHGIFSNRAALLAVADSLAEKGLIGIAIDLPLHGIANVKSPAFSLYYGPPINGKTGDFVELYKATVEITAPNVANPPLQGCPMVGAIRHCFGERTFNYPVGQGLDSSGLHYLNVTSLLTTRDNLRESVVGLMYLWSILKSHANIPVVSPGQGKVGMLTINNERMGYFGHSLGGIVGTIFTAVESQQDFPSVLAMPGGGIVRLLLGSPNFSGLVTLLVERQYAVEQGQRGFLEFARIAQTLQDSGDPVNYAPTLAKQYEGPLPDSDHPIHLVEVIGNGDGHPPDQTVPNNVLEPPYVSSKTSLKPAPLSGTDPLISLMGLKTVQVTLPVKTDRRLPGFAATQFTAGGHSTIIRAADPSATPVNAEMQCEAAGFLASDGQFIPVGCATVP